MRQTEDEAGLHVAQHPLTLFSLTHSPPLLTAHTTQHRADWPAAATPILSDTVTHCLTPHALTRLLTHCSHSILGMNLFGCKFCHKHEDGVIQCDRKNFDSLLWALVTVFQVRPRVTA